MFKWFNKQTIVSFILGLCVMASIPTYAAVSKTFKSAKFNNYKITVDGKEVQNDYPTLLLQTNEDKGSKAYMPLRPVVEALGARISVDDANQTYLITTTDITPFIPSENIQNNNQNTTTNSAITSDNGFKDLKVPTITFTEDDTKK